MASATQQPTTNQVNRALDVIASFVESFEPGRYSGGDAADLVTRFARGERLCAAGKTLAARRAADAHQHQHGGHRTPAHWLAEATGESVGDAIDVLSLGDSLAAHPGIDSAYRGGKLSRSKAKAISGALRVNPGAEDELVATAEGDTARQVRDRCQRARAQGWSRQDAKARYDAIQKDRSCRTWTDTETGAFRLDARLTPDAGAALKAALGLESDRVFHRARRAGHHESPEAYAADALVALVTRDPGRSTATSSDDQSPNGGRPTTKGSKGTRALVHVRVDLDALRTGVVGPHGICEIPGVGPIPVDTARELMGDALCELVITNGIDVTTITKMGRAIPAALRRALDERDATCVVPGCDAVTGLEIDHRIVEVHDNGPTAMWNLAKLCAHHHDLRHHGGFTLAGGPGNWRWIPPGGDPGPPGDPPDSPEPGTKRPIGRNGRNRRSRSDRRPDPSERAPRRFPKQE
ncbi:MAG: HNH endonuclease signature motif containing protein [Acidimicrobiales bacterium]